MVNIKKTFALIILITHMLMLLTNCENPRKINNNIDRTIPGFGLLDDFNDGLDPNLWGGLTLKFYTQTGGEEIKYEYDSSNDLHNRGYAFKLTFNVPNSGQSAGIDIKLAPGDKYRNLSGFRYLYFWIKGNPEKIPLKIELKNNSDSSRKQANLYLTDYLDSGVTNDWQLVKIPLDAFCNLDTFERLTNIVFVFEHDYADMSSLLTSGTLYIDNIGFGETSLGYVRIDSFGDKWNMNALGSNTGNMGNGNGVHTLSYDSFTFHDHQFGLKSDYDVTTDWCGISMPCGGGSDGFSAQPYDFSVYSKITMWIKGSGAASTPDRIKIEINDEDNNHFAYIPDDSTTPLTDITSDNWTQHSILFSNFTQFSGPALNTNAIQQINIVYENHKVGSNLNGTVYFDEIQFEK